MAKPLSLKMRAIGLLSQREHSLAELRRKLLRIQAASAAARRPEEVEGEEAAAGKGEAEVNELLAWLQAQGYLSEVRFVESRINARSQRYGSLRIKQELAQHGLTLSAANQAELKATELARARAIWQRKFGGGMGGIGGASAANASREEDPRGAAGALRAKQIRFLTARGFAPEVVRQVLKNAGRDED